MLFELNGKLVEEEKKGELPTVKGRYASMFVATTNPIFNGMNKEAALLTLLLLYAIDFEANRKAFNPTLNLVPLTFLYGVLEQLYVQYLKKPSTETSKLRRLFQALNEASGIGIFSLSFNEMICVDIGLRGRGTQKKYRVTREMMGLLGINPAIFAGTQFAASYLLTDKKAELMYPRLNAVHKKLLKPLTRFIVIESAYEFSQDMLEYHRDGSNSEICLRYGSSLALSLVTYLLQYLLQRHEESLMLDDESRINWPDYFENLISAVCYAELQMYLISALTKDDLFSEADAMWQMVLMAAMTIFSFGLAYRHHPAPEGLRSREVSGAYVEEMTDDLEDADRPALLPHPYTLLPSVSEQSMFRRDIANENPNKANVSEGLLPQASNLL